MERALLSAMGAPMMAGLMLETTSLAGQVLGRTALATFGLGGIAPPFTSGSSPRDEVSKYMKVFSADPER